MLVQLSKTQAINIVIKLINLFSYRRYNTQDISVLTDDYSLQLISGHPVLASWRTFYPEPVITLTHVSFTTLYIILFALKDRSGCCKTMTH